MTAPLHPTLSDLQRWRRLVRQAQLMGQTPTLPVGDLARAAKEARKAVAPTREALTALCSPLIRLAEAWPAMDDGTRRVNAAQMTWLAVALAPLVGMPDRPLSREALGAARRAAAEPAEAADRLGLHIPAPEPMADDPRPERGPRLDIDG